MAHTLDRFLAGDSDMSRVSTQIVDFLAEFFDFRVTRRRRQFLAQFIGFRTDIGLNETMIQRRE